MVLSPCLIKSTPARARTWDLRIRNPVLFRLSYGRWMQYAQWDSNPQGLSATTF